MTSKNNHEKSMLKLAQLRSLIRSNANVMVKNIDIVLEGVDLNLRIPSTVYLEKHDSESINSTLLHVAYKQLNIDTFDILLRKGAKFDIGNKDGKTILHDIFYFPGYQSNWIGWDIKNNRIEQISQRIPFIVSTLSAHVKYKNTNNPSNSHGLTHFHIACAVNHIEAVELFLGIGVPVNQVCTKVDKDLFQGYTALHFAAHFGYFETAQILLKNGANVNLEDAKGRTPLHISVERNIAIIGSTEQDYELEEILRNERVMNLLLNHAGNPKLPRLCVVSAMHNSKEIKKLLTQEIDVNQSIGKESQIWPGYTALHFAAHANIETVQALMEHEANIEAKDVNGVSPFDICIKRYKPEDIFDICCMVQKWYNILMSDGKTKLVDLLYTFGNSERIKNFLKKSDKIVKLFVPPDSPLWPGFSILHLVVLLTKNADLTIVAECLKQDADVTVKDHRNWTPVHLAYRLEKTETLNLLLKYHHRTKNFVDDENLSHLHIACAVKNRDLVEKLLWNDADVNIVYQGNSCVLNVQPGSTPLHVALHVGDTEIVKKLLKFSANVHLADKYGYTPIHELPYVSYCPKEFNKMLFNSSNLRNITVENTGLNYLHVACLEGNVEAVEKLLALEIDINKAIACQSEDGKIFPGVLDQTLFDSYTPLHCLMEYCYSTSEIEIVLQILNLLVKRNADMFVGDSKKITPFNKIVRYGSYDILDFIVEAFKRNDDLRKRLEMETGLTMLHIACRKVDVDMIKELLDNKANINAQIFENSTLWPGYTPLHVLIRSFDHFVEQADERVPDFNEIVKLMLDHRADVTLMDTKKRTPLHVAYHNLYVKSVGTSLTQTDLMLKAHKNFDINPTTTEGVSHFHIACHLLDVEVVENFLEHDVNVNSEIDAFCNFDIAASTPIILASKTRNWKLDNYTKSLSESFAQLKIVDLLIKHGALINVEDINGNSPVHYAASCSFLKENLLERLANSGADVNARNVRGITPLELRFNKRNLTLEEIRYYIKCGCRFNAFNSVTDEGYVAQAANLLSHEDMQCLLHSACINSPDLVNRDDMDRTVIHNLVCMKSTKISDTEYAKFFYLLMGFNYDIDDRDNLGKTALHLAAQFRNESAIAGLLSVGADINITDQSGKTPFAYVLEPCSRCNKTGEDHDQYCHEDVFKVFAIQIYKLQLCNFEISKSNEQLTSDTYKKFDPDDFLDDQDDFLPQLQAAGKWKIEPYKLSVSDFMSDNGAIVDYPLMSQDKRKTISKFFRTNKSKFHNQFGKVAGLIQLQYRKAVLRCKIIDIAKNSLSALMKFRLDDLCAHFILRMLKNSELQNLILAASN